MGNATDARNLPSSNVRPLMAHAVNAERLALAVTEAHAAGHTNGYHKGFLAGARWTRLVSFGWGCVAGAGLVAGAVKLGLLAGA